MDQSLRTVATQLLNVTSTDDMMKLNTKELTAHDIVTTEKFSEKKDASTLIRVGNAESNNADSIGVSFGRPINSKFSYFESSHPGQAMAMTEEELEREMSTTRLITAYKNNPTTTGGISTWILLNPPSTTVKNLEAEKKTMEPFQTEVRLTMRPSSMETIEMFSQPEKVTEKIETQTTPIITTEKIIESTKNPTTTTLKKIMTTLKPTTEKITPSLEKIESSTSTTLKAITTTTTTSALINNDTTSSAPVVTTKKSQTSRNPPKVKVTTPKTSNSKPTSASTKTSSRPNQQNRPPKPTPTRRTTVKSQAKNDTASTAKIEKVTFKPIQMITSPINKQENTEKPMFVTKIKASVLMDTHKAATTLLPTPTATTLSTGITIKSNLSGSESTGPIKSKPTGTKTNNVLKVQLKKPTDESTKIEIEPIKVNAPILKIEKIDKNKMDDIVDQDTDDLNNSKIDLKFDFNPELTKINVETQTKLVGSTATTTASTTTKRPRHNSKRKKNKIRRRKPSSTPMTSSSTTITTVLPNLMEIGDSVTDSDELDNAIQESKIAPDTKAAVNGTKTKKKQPQKAITTQIYNFLSREVMPSFGVMSLVGLGLGIASYFLYPFGGGITRRNYEVEPKYKYNLDEYAGNYGQSEEEVLSKVFQGMTNQESKYPGTKDVNSNYYHYQRYDGAYDHQTTKKSDPRYPSISTSPLHRPMENTLPAVKYRNTDFRYPETQTTPVYYDRKHSDLDEVSGSANRQFVVGNVPKEYPFEAKTDTLPIVSKKRNGVGYESTESDQTQFERDIAQSFNFGSNPANIHSYSHLDRSTVRPDDGYEEIEITPTAVAVEHGPRALKVKRDITDRNDRYLRSKRESVIQIIPSKRELEVEEKEEDLSNEILDIIDSALPGTEDQRLKKNSENNEIEDVAAQKKKQHEAVKTRTKESTMKILTTKNIGSQEDTTNMPASVEFISKITERISDNNLGVSLETSTVHKNITETHAESTTTNSKDTTGTTIEWFESTSTKKPMENFSLFNFVKKVAEIKFRLGLTILKHASEGFARYLGHVQKRINGEE